ncbi:MAG: ImmA/IrrE family metallo-endopeptidase [Bacteroidetes bacterium]|nr:ImmA/IrrE family metallo-endopeptidase [Bacteroidota bacterium]
MYRTKEDIKTARQIISPPGDTLAETLSVKGISQPSLALRMGRPIKTINEIIKGKTAITPETAIQLERVLGIEAAFWLEREKNYRLELAQLEEAEILLNTKDWVDNFPLSAMKKLKWLTYEDNILSKASALYSFFGVSGQEPYYNYYHKNVYESAYRMSKSSGKNPYAVSAWLRQGEHQSEELSAATYDLQRFKSALQEIKSIMAKQPVNFFSSLQSICSSTGVKVVHTPCLPKTNLHGSTRWINDNPLIQLSNLYNRNDIFWFTFFHEAGHIVKHGKRDIFVEGLEYSEEEMIKENEADEFAVKFTLTDEQEAELVENLPLTKKSIIDFATRFNTHPALIIGRFAREHTELNKLGWSLEYFQSVNLSLS